MTADNPNLLDGHAYVSSDSKITLRDIFAGMAMQGEYIRHAQVGGAVKWQQELASNAYTMADEMLKARSCYSE